MAIYHLSGKIISRSQGRSSVAAAAYRSCSRLEDDRTGLTHDFNRKGHDLVACDILLPKDAPKKFADRETLWNAVEKKENRKDAQLCREFNISLPIELTNAQNWELAREFVQSEFVDRGMIADVAFHRGHKSQEGQPHLHVMLTMRHIDKDGFGQKNRSWNDKVLLEHWREAWADQCNRSLLRHGHDMRIDHRTLEAQDINLEPQTKIGAKAAAARMARFEEHKERARENGERILQDPGIILKSITNQQSTFAHRDVARVVSRYTDGSEQFQAAYSKVLAHSDMVRIGQDAKGVDRYTTQEMLATEKRLVDDAMRLAAQHGHVVSDAIRESVASGYTMSASQRKAYDYLLEHSDMRNMVGIAGSGKSYLMGAVREAHEKSGHHVIGMALSGKAAEGLEHSSGIASRTVASYIAAWDNERDLLTRKDVIVIDEAGMLGSIQYARLMHEAQRAGAKVVTAFDSEQLQAINAGAAARAVAQRTGFIELTEVRRQKEAWQKEATLQFSSMKTTEALASYIKHDNVHAYATKEMAIGAVLEQWQEIRSANPEDTQLMLAYTRKEVQRLNESARDIRKENGELRSQEYSILTDRGKRSFSEGDRIYFLKNEYQDMNIKNGTLGTIERIDSDRIQVKIDSPEKGKEGRFVHVDLSQYNHIDHGYASTIHKSQGTTVDHTQVLANKMFDRHLAYVGMTRHTDTANLYYSQEEFANDKQLCKGLSRDGSKDFTLDYAQTRGFEATDHQAEERKQTVESVYDKSHQVSPDEHSKEFVDRQVHLDKIRETPELKACVERIEKNTGLSLSTDLQDGDKGIYKGTAQIGEERYGILDVGKGQGKLIPKDMMESRHREKEMRIELQKDDNDREMLKATQSYNRQRQRDYERGIER